MDKQGKSGLPFSRVMNWKLFGVELGARTLCTLVAFLAVTYMAASNWQWYKNDLGHSIKHPDWANHTSNWIIWVVWFGISLFVWNRHQVKHLDAVRMDLFYPVVLLLTFIMFTLFFEQRQLGAAKFCGILNIILMGYIIYEGFVTDSLVAGLLVVNFAILLYTVAQMWYFSRNETVATQQMKWSELPANDICAPIVVTEKAWYE